MLFLLGISCILFAGLWHFTVFLSVRLLPFPNMTGFIASLFLSYPFVSHVSNPIRVFLCLIVLFSISNFCRGYSFYHATPSRECHLWIPAGDAHGVCLVRWRIKYMAFAFQVGAGVVLPSLTAAILCSVLFFLSSSGSAYMVCIWMMMARLFLLLIEPRLSCQACLFQLRLCICMITLAALGSLRENNNHAIC